MGRRMKPRKPIVSISRIEILERDGRKCHYCKHPLTLWTMHVDHVAPVSRGGSDEPKNLVASCPRCNISKGERSLTEWKPDFVFLPDADLQETIDEWAKSFEAYMQGRESKRQEIQAKYEQRRIDVEQKLEAEQKSRASIPALPEPVITEDDYWSECWNDILELDEDGFDELMAERIKDCEGDARKQELIRKYKFVTIRLPRVTKNE